MSCASMILALSSALDRLERDTSSAAAEARLGRGVVVRVPACVRHVHVWPGTPRPVRGGGILNSGASLS